MGCQAQKAARPEARDRLLGQPGQAPEEKVKAIYAPALDLADLPDFPRFRTPRDKMTPREQISPGLQSTICSEVASVTSFSTDPSSARTSASNSPRQDYGTDEESDSIWVLAPCKPAVEGQYDRVDGQLVNGDAVWRQVEGDGWLFCSFDGRWTVSDGPQEVDRDVGLLRTADPHYSKLPHECSRWMYREELGTWASDNDGQVLVTNVRARVERRLQRRTERSTRLALAAQRRAAKAPRTLWVVAPPRPALQGTYNMEDSEHMNGYPVWKQQGGKGYLFSSEKDQWIISGDAPNRIRQKSQMQLRTSSTHAGKMPNEVTSWKYTESGGVWIADVTKSIRVFADKEAAAFVLANYDCGTLEEAAAEI